MDNIIFFRNVRCIKGLMEERREISLIELKKELKKNYRRMGKIMNGILSIMLLTLCSDKFSVDSENEWIRENGLLLVGIVWVGVLSLMWWLQSKGGVWAQGIMSGLNIIFFSQIGALVYKYINNIVLTSGDYITYWHIRLYRKWTISEKVEYLHELERKLSRNDLNFSEEQGEVYKGLAREIRIRMKPSEEYLLKIAEKSTTKGECLTEWTKYWNDKIAEVALELQSGGGVWLSLYKKIETISSGSVWASIISCLLLVGLVVGSLYVVRILTNWWSYIFESRESAAIKELVQGNVAFSKSITLTNEAVTKVNMKIEKVEADLSRHAEGMECTVKELNKIVLDGMQGTKILVDHMMSKTDQIETSMGVLKNVVENESKRVTTLNEVVTVLSDNLKNLTLYVGKMSADKTGIMHILPQEIKEI